MANVDHAQTCQCWSLPVRPVAALVSEFWRGRNHSLDDYRSCCFAVCRPQVCTAPMTECAAQRRGSCTHSRGQGRSRAAENGSDKAHAEVFSVREQAGQLADR